jgi:hypothetical protein
VDGLDVRCASRRHLVRRGIVQNPWSLSSRVDGLSSGSLGSGLGFWEVSVLDVSVGVDSWDPVLVRVLE